jgi:hypothetical protein
MGLERRPLAAEVNPHGRRWPSAQTQPGASFCVRDPPARQLPFLP